MNNTLEILKTIYKPYRYTIIGKVTLLETTSGEFIVKPKNKDLKELYKYLDNRGFQNYVKLIDSSRSDVNIFEYIEDSDLPKEQKCNDLVETLASLHNKTCYFKNISTDTYQEIYESILSNINYLANYYNTLFDIGFNQVYLTPFNNTLLTNYSKILNILENIKDLLDRWYNLVKNETKMRVSIVHNNISLDHFINNTLISWDNYVVDTPVIDLVKLYKEIYMSVDLYSVFDKYLSLFPLLDYEKNLFFILISIPTKVGIDDTEFNKCRNLSKLLDYITITDEFVKYYTEEKNENNE